MGDIARILRQGGDGTIQVTRPGSTVARDDDGNKGIGGFLENLAGGVGDLVKGVGSIVGSTVHDAVALTGNALTPFDDERSDYQLDDIAKALPGAIVDDVSQRYGMLLPGGRPAGDIFGEMYKEPLSFGLDALTVASGAGKAAEVAARTGIVGGRAADAILPGLKAQRAGIKQFGEQVPLGGNAVSIVPETGRAVVKPLASNPARRLPQALLHKMRTHGGRDELTRAVDDFDIKIANAVDGDPITEWRAQRDVITEALKTESPAFLKAGKSQKVLDRLAKRMVNESGARFVSNRDRLIHQHREILSRLPKGEPERFFSRALGLEDTPGAGRVDFESVAQTVSDGTPKMDRVTGVAKPHIERIREMEQQLPTLEPDAQALLLEEIDAAKRLVEIVAGEPLAAHQLNMVDDISDVMDDTRLLNLEREAEVFLATGGTYKSLFDRLYLPQRIKMQFETGASLDELPSARQLDDIRKADNLKAPVYYPASDTLGHSRADFLMKYRTHGATRAAKPSSFKKSRGSTIKNFLDGITDAFDTDASEAYARLASEVTGFEEMLRLTDDLKREFGVRVTAKDQIPPGWKLINPQGVSVMMRKNHDMRMGMAEEISKGRTVEDAFAETSRKVFVDNPDEIRQLFDARAELYAVPETVAEKLNSMSNWSLPKHLESKVRLYHDSAMHAWRNYTLYLRPAFYLNNIFGNTTFLGLQGGSFTSLFKQLDKGYRNSLKGVIDELGVTDDVHGGFFSDLVQRKTDLGPAAETKVGSVAKRVAESKTARAGHKPIELGQRLNQVIEESFRRESFVRAAEKDLARRGVKMAGTKFARSQKRLEQMMRYGIDNPQSVSRWLDEMNDTMNNYRALGPFERKVVRRFIAPFWPFYKHASKTLIKMPFEHPAKADLLRVLGEMHEEMLAENVGEVDSWLESAIPIGTNPDGTTEFLTTGGQNPFQGVMQNPGGLIGPLGQMAFEQVTGIDPFTLDPLRDPNAQYPYGSDTGYEFNEETGQMEPLERRAGGVLAPYAPNPLEQLLQQLPFYSAGKKIAGGGGLDDAGNVIREPSGEPKYPTDPLQEILKLLGYSTIDYDAEGFQRRRAQEQSAARSQLGP